MTMTPEAKRKLSQTIRSLRTYLLEENHRAVESRYVLKIKDAAKAGLDEATTVERRRFEAWLDEQVRAADVAEQSADTKGPKKKGGAKKGAAKNGGAKKGKAASDTTARDRDAFRRDAEKQAAYTLLNRMVFLRLAEAAGLRDPHVVTGGWNSRGYRDFRELNPAFAASEETEGYVLLLELVFQDLATELPGLYGPAGIADLVPVRAATLRRVVEALDDPALASCWTDDMTLGWVYQYWNDPEREGLDDKLNAGGKVEPHEIAQKTQMFTERYMVDWLLQNSLGPLWLAICQKNGWTAECVGSGLLDGLEARRADWREKRERGEVELTELMPLESDAERRWAYYVAQPIPDDAVARAPESIRDVKLLDPAVGSGHFLVVAFDLLFALYREEARHRGEAADGAWDDKAIAERILERNLHGLDLDARAVQIAAAALWLKAKQTSRDAEPETMSLVASNLRLASLSERDPALVELRREIERETGIPAELTNQIVAAVAGADHLGSLLKVDAAVDDAIAQHGEALGKLPREQGDLFAGFKKKKRKSLPPDRARAEIVTRIEAFLAKHSAGDELGLRLRGDQLARGIHYLRMLREGQYDLVVGNPPYQGTSKMADASYVEQHYPLGKADLYAAFLLRGLELVREGGTSALLTMRNWMFIKQYAALREHLLKTHDLRALGDFDRGAFEDVPDEVVSVAVSVFRSAKHVGTSIAQCPTPRDDRTRDSGRTKRKRAATLCQVGRHKFDPAALKVVPEWPVVYWWDDDFLQQYASAPKLADISDVRQGMATANNDRFLRMPWELQELAMALVPFSSSSPEAFAESRVAEFVPYIKGAEGKSWIEPLSFVVRAKDRCLEIKSLETNGKQASRPQNEEFYFMPGVAFSSTGSVCRGRLHRYRSIFDVKGQSAFPPSPAEVCCAMNSAIGRSTLGDLNPSISFQVGDALRLAVFPEPCAARILDDLSRAFGQHESHREPSVEFRHPGPSPWRYAQAWAQTAVDRPEGAPLPPYEPEYDPEPPTDHLSFALGVALGRFHAEGEGILDPTTADLAHALPAGVLFLDRTLDDEDRRDGLGHPAAALLQRTWDERGRDIAPKRSLRTYLALDFFKDVHRSMYENRPIHFPLSSEKKTFVAWVNIHRWDGQTLRYVLSEHLHQAATRLDGELSDLREARDGDDKKAARDAEKRFDQVSRYREELAAFIDAVTQCAEKGPPPPDDKTTKRQVDTQYVPDLDDGVMINGAALYPLLEPQWKDPKKWYKELATSAKSKDYDWAHLAMRYWPDRVDDKCQRDPSLGVAHGCFWRYHPERAWAWELRLQDEIGPDFRIEEAPYDPPGLSRGPTGDEGDAAHRRAYLRDRPEPALAAVEKEALRRRGRGKDAGPIAELRLLEEGLWPAVPELCQALEKRVSEKQGAPFLLRAPDEPGDRAALSHDSARALEPSAPAKGTQTSLRLEHDS